MILSVFSPVLANKTLEDSLKYLKSLKVDAMELGCGGYPGTAHADAKELIKSDAKVRELKGLFKSHGIAISALSVHGNCVHPDPAVAAAFEADYRAACELAGKLGVERLITFSGCPGDGKGDKPNWVTCAWPNDYAEVLQYQWDDVLVPYWEKASKFAAENGVKYIALEMHPGFCVYNPRTMLELRRRVGDFMGANLDPSHLIWQGIDIPAAVKALGKAIHFFHAKDTALNPEEIRVNGVLDTKPYNRELERSWIFRSVGHGMDDCTWKQIFAALRMVGYDYAISIEHEDSLMSPKEGLEKAIAFLQENMIRESNDAEMWWL